MLSRIVPAALVAGLLVLVPTAANAVEDQSAGSVIAVANTDGYTPNPPEEPSLAGSAALSDCIADAPWINFSVVLTDRNHDVTNTTATLFMTDGVNTHEIALGQLVDGALSGSVLWPGATVDGNGVATGWPGWTLQNGNLVETTGNFAWTRGNITAEIRVNPALAVPLSYPPASPVCTPGPRSEVPTELPLSDSSLPATGMSAAVLPITVGAIALLALGGGLLITRRRARQ